MSRRSKPRLTNKHGVTIAVDAPQGSLAYMIAQSHGLTPEQAHEIGERQREEEESRKQADAVWMILHRAKWRMIDEANFAKSEAEHPERYYLRDVDVGNLQDLAKGRPIFNGCTSVWLSEIYGDVRHEMGVGWYIIRPDVPAEVDSEPPIV